MTTFAFRTEMEGDNARVPDLFAAIGIINTNEEIISENATTDTGNISDTQRLGQVTTVDFDIPTTVIKAGEYIRVTVATTAPGASKEIVVCHDPEARDTPGGNSLGAAGTLTQPDTTILKALLPVNINL